MLKTGGEATRGIRTGIEITDTREAGKEDVIGPATATTNSEMVEAGGITTTNTDRNEDTPTIIPGARDFTLIVIRNIVFGIKTFLFACMEINSNSYGNCMT